MQQDLDKRGSLSLSLALSFLINNLTETPITNFVGLFLLECYQLIAYLDILLLTRT